MFYYIHSLVTSKHIELESCNIPLSTAFQRLVVVLATDTDIAVDSLTIEGITRGQFWSECENLDYSANVYYHQH